MAQAALQSKRGIAADIQRQEAQNQKLRAQGAQQVNQQLLSLEQQKLSLEGQAISAEEKQAEIDRLYGEKDFYTSRGLSMRDAATDSLMGGLSSSVSLGVNAYAAGLIGDGGGNTNSSSSNIAPSSSSYFTPSSSNQSPTGGSGMGAINNMDYYGNFNEFVTEFSR